MSVKIWSNATRLLTEKINNKKFERDSHLLIQKKYVSKEENLVVNFAFEIQKITTVGEWKKMF